jgi:hypothetical protein
MAIRIPILTTFDPKGLRAANAQFGKLQSSVGSLGRNFAVLGAAVAGAGVLIAKNVQALARIERINAQTEQTIKSMGNTAGISAQGIEALAGSLETLTATEAETIQEGANLLLTFKNIQNQAGEGNDIFTQTAGIMVDLARAMGTSASGEAIRLGKALNDPIRGLTALTRVGVSFTDEQREQVKALQQSGDLMGAQKIILAELQQQFGGSGAAFAKTFAGQLELMGHELGTIGEEATMSVLPALQGMVGQLRELIPVIGPQLKAAIESIDIPALADSFAKVTTFLITNATAIANTIIALFALNTAFKVVQVASGVASVAFEVQKWWLAQLAIGLTNATIATNLLSGAMRFIPIVAIVAGIASITTELFKAAGNFSAFRTQIEQTSPAISDLDRDMASLSATFLTFDIKGNPFLQVLQDAIKLALRLTGALDSIPKEITTTVKVIRQDAGQVASSFGGSAFDARTSQFQAGGSFVSGVTPKAPSSGGGSQTQTVKQAIAAGTLQANREAKLLKTGISAGFADLILGKVTNKATFQKELGKLTKTTNSATKAQAKFNKTSAGRAEVAQQAAAASAAASSAAAEYAAAVQAAADAEAAALAERERVYQSFADSVKNTFASIKNSILGAFDLTELGGSTNAITRNMDKLLVRLRAFAANVSKLSGMGLDPALLQQVITAGPLAGARLAETLAMGGAGALAAINAGYSEFGTLSSQIAQTGTESLFNREAQQSVYNINVDGGVGSGATIGKAIVDAIKAYERTSGAVWQGA